MRLNVVKDFVTFDAFQKVIGPNSNILINRIHNETYICKEILLYQTGKGASKNTLKIISVRNAGLSREVKSAIILTAANHGLVLK